MVPQDDLEELLKIILKFRQFFTIIDLEGKQRNKESK
jgi:hypothetical protein